MQNPPRLTSEPHHSGELYYFLKGQNLRQFTFYYFRFVFYCFTKRPIV